MKRTRLILVGGFLGAGKTTLLYEAAQRLTRQGCVVGLITNDQTDNLVDTAVLARTGFGVREVAGSCFCCDFDGFIEAAESLVAHHGVDVILAEPVGSCTDLSATILQPIKTYHQAFSLAPYTVLADPERLREVLVPKSAAMHASALYIVRKQIEEADRVLLSKVDLLSKTEREAMLGFLERAFPEVSASGVSAQTGEGVDAWIAGAMAAGGAGDRIAQVDYDTYAEGEAVLGWLNTVIRWKCTDGVIDWAEVFIALTRCFHGRLQERGAAVGHVKLIAGAGGKQFMANLTRLGGDWMERGARALPAPAADMVFNARVEMAPAELETLVREVVHEVCGDGVTAVFEQMKALSPGRPRPTHRFQEVVHS